MKIRINNVYDRVDKIKSWNLKTTILDYTLTIKISLLLKSGFLKILFLDYLIYTKN